MNKCIICNKEFIPKKGESTLACPPCKALVLKNIDEDIKNGVKYKCYRCKKKFVIKKKESTLICDSCGEDIKNGESYDFPEPIDNRFEILDL